MHWRRAQLLVPGLGLAMSMGYVALEWTMTIELLLYIAPIALLTGGTAYGAWRAHRRTGWPWVMAAASMVLTLIAEVLCHLLKENGVEPFPSVADAFFLLAYVPLGLTARGLVRRGTHDDDQFGWIDSLVVASAAAVPMWIWFIEPVVNDATLSGLARVVSVAYPIADLFVVGMAVRLVISPACRSRGGLLFVGSLIALLGADLAFAGDALADAIQPGGLLSVAYIVSYALLTAAALDDGAAAVRAAPSLSTDATQRLAIVLVAATVPQIGAWWWLHDRGLVGLTLPSVIIAVVGFTTLLATLRSWLLLRRTRATESKLGADRLAAIVESSSSAILLIDRAGNIVYSSAAADDLWPPEQTQPTSFLDRVDRAQATEVLTTVLIEPMVAHDAEFTVGDRIIDASVRNLLDHPAVGAIVATLRDVTEERRLQSELQRTAFHDDLTGLANRALFVDRVGHALDRCARRAEVGLAVLLIDLDDFKAVNDGLGHAAGDELLATVADRLRECIRPADTIARLGGDEFAVLLEDVMSEREAMHVATRALEMLSMPIGIAGSSITVPASIGIAPRSESSTTGSLLREADIAMYHAKSLGKRRAAMFDASMRIAAERRLALRVDLPRAFDDGEVSVVYQPIYAASERRLAGFEALARWEHPRFGSIAPRDFIAAAEESGFIGRLGTWILREACAQAATWPAVRSGGARLHVNIAAGHLLLPDFVETLTAVLAATRLPGQALVIEVPEAAMAGGAHTIAMFHRIRLLGVGIAIDDFGVGHSSLSNVQQFPVTALKIDVSFVGAMGRGDNGLARSVLGVAQALGLTAIAEGVETNEQLQALVAMGCDLAQGHLLGRPEEPTRISGWLAPPLPAAPVPAAPAPTPPPVPPPAPPPAPIPTPQLVGAPPMS